MKFFFGLGNPGSVYEKNRHNVGHMALDYIARVYDYPVWREKFNSLVSEGTIGKNRVMLVKPQTFMNLSGNAVVQFVKFYKFPINELLVFHDELDVKRHELKFKQGGGHAGHNGLRSIHEKIGPNYNRIRIGIGKPENQNDISKYVLSNFDSTDSDKLEKIFSFLAAEAKSLAINDFDAFKTSIKSLR